MSMDPFHILIAFPSKILDVTSGAIYYFLPTPYVLKKFWDIITVFKQLKACYVYGS